MNDSMPISMNYFEKERFEMLKTINHLLIKKGGKLTNIDITIVCELPKISKYKAKMRETLAKILNISESRVNIKATTTEKLGFVGREEGISAYSTCLIYKL